MINWITEIDKNISLFFLNLKNPILISFFIDLYYLFYFVFLIFILFVYFIERDRKKFRKIAIITLIGFILVFSLKFLIKRERPETSLIIKTDYSFPSSHSFFSTVLFAFSGSGFIGLLFKLISILSFISLLYIQVHYFSDVVFSILLFLFINYFYNFIENFLKLAEKKKLEVGKITIQRRKIKVKKARKE